MFPKSQPRASRPPKNKQHKNTKLTGERSEAAFLNRAASLGFGVAKPWGDSLRYDFILDNGQRLWRVQVKATESIRAQAYETRATYTVGKGRAVYTRDDVDFLAAHACPERSRRIVPLDIWYIIPVEVCTPAPMLRFYPHREAKKMRLEPYREAWHLLQSTSGHALIEIHASRNEEYVGTTAQARDAHVGTAAPGCPAEQSSAAAEDDLKLTWLTPRPKANGA